MRNNSSFQLIGATLPRTGTMTLKAALSKMGFGNSYHMHELFQRPNDLPHWQLLFEGEKINWDIILNGYTSILDFPGCLMVDKLIESFPNAKVILTARNPEEWYNSIINTVYKAVYMPEHINSPIFNFIKKYFFDEFLNGKIEEKNEVMEICNNYYQRIRNTVPKNKLLEYSVSEGWVPLCKFFDCRMPKEIFPYKNTQKDFIKRNR